MDNIDLILSRMDGLEANMKDHFVMCSQNCMGKISTVESIAEKAHTRLDKQKESIECLAAHKNKEVGFRRAISWVVGVMALVIAYIGLEK